MIKYTLRRLLQAIPTFLGITILSYILMASSGNPVRLLTFGNRNITPQQRMDLEKRLGLADPVPVQYLRWLLGDDWMRRDTDGDGVSDTAIIIALDVDNDGEPEPPGQSQGILRGDFGESLIVARGRQVIDVIAERVGPTLELGAAALITGLVIGVPIGILAAVRRGGWFDNLTRVLAVVFNAIPVFWLGLILILVFGVALDLLPMGGRSAATLRGGSPPIYERIQYMILPTFVLATGAIAVYSRYMRASMLDVMSQDYMRTARSKGLSNRSVWFFHGARNALIPLATFLGPAVTTLLSGAAITERIFSWPGLGQLAVASVTSLDFPLVMATVIIGSVSTILGYILSDILYALIDPRIRFN